MARRGVRIAVVVALAVAAVAFATIVASSSGTYRLTAVFEQTHGLVEGAEVQVAGEKVGEVKAIELGEDGFPRVEMEISDDFVVRRGGQADLRFFSVAGETNRFIDLTQGKGPELEDGATIGIARSDEPVEIDAVLSTLDPATRGDVRALLARIDLASDGRGPDIDRTLRHSADALAETAALVREVSSDGVALRTFVQKGRQVVSAIAREPAALGGSADELAALLRTTGRHETQVAASLELLPAALREPRFALERTAGAVPALRETVRVARPAVRELVPFSRDLRPALAAARPALGEAQRLISRSPADLRVLSRLLAAARPVLARLSPVLVSANPMLDELRARLPDVFAFFANWADFTADYDANGHGARVGLVFNEPPRNEIGPSDSGAGLLASPFDRTPGVLEGEPWTGYRGSFTGGARP